MRTAATEQDRHRTLVGLNYESALNISRFARSIIIVGAGAHATTSKLEKDGHHVIVTYGDPLVAPPDAIHLERPNRWDFSKALENAGVEEHEAIRIAREVGSSITVISRLRPHGIGNRPWWVDGEHADLLRPFCLLGQWDASNPYDRAIVEKIANEPWDTIQQRLVICLAKEDTPFANAGQIWALGSHVDLFTLLAPGLGDAQFKRFADAVREVFRPQAVLTEADADDQAFSPPKGVSEWVRDGLAHALLLLAVRAPQTLSCPIAVGSEFQYAAPQAFVERLLSELGSLGSYRQLYASITRQYTVLIEAGPDPLLEALERWLEGSPDEVREVLTSSRGLLADWPNVTEMLWGLQVLAWSADHLPRIASALTKLAIIHPTEGKGERRENKALDVLSRILMWWSPQTFATLDQRIAVIDQVLEEEDEVGWALLGALSPTGHMIQTPTAKPRMRDFSPDHREIVTRRIAYEGVKAIAYRRLAHAGASITRWIEIIDSFSQFPPDLRAETRRHLESLVSKNLDLSRRTALWTAIRDETARHRRFVKAAWALPAEEIEQWEQLQHRIAPDDPVAQCRWLFDEWLPDLPEELTSGRDIQALTDQRRRVAISELLRRAGSEGVLELARQAKLPNFVGVATGAEMASIEDLAQLTRTGVRDERLSERFISSLLWSASQRFTRLVAEPVQTIGSIVAWAEEQAIAPPRIASMLTWLPLSKRTLDFIDSLSEPIVEQYWKHMPIPVDIADDELAARVVQKLVAACRASELSQMVSFGKININGQQVLTLLDAVIDEIAKGGWNRPHSLPEFLKFVANRADIADGELASREIKLVPLLGYHHGVPLRLYRILCSEPELFVTLICQIYRKASDRGTEPAELPTENAKQLASRAYQLLSSWRHHLSPDELRQPEGKGARTFPAEDADGNVDADALHRWVSRARELAAREDRSEAADSEIGHLLAYAPFDRRDKGWPTREVRDVIEKNWSEALAQGICTEQFNKRGVHSVEEGGLQEQSLRDQALGWAKVVGHKWPKTRRLLQDVAKMWEGDRRRAVQWDAVRKLEDRTN